VLGLWLLEGLRTLLLVVIAMTQTALIAFYGLTGQLGYSRMLGGIDSTIPLAAFMVGTGCFVVIRMLPYIAAPRRMIPHNRPVDEPTWA
jgi:F0F1-type ATP synthase assembly protein I